MPSGIFHDGDVLHVGVRAQQLGAQAPQRYERHPRLRVDDGVLLLGDVVVTVQQGLGAVLAAAVGAARSAAGGAEIDELVLTHPARWAQPRRCALLGAASGCARRVRTVAEPVAVAHHFCQGLASGVLVAVLEVGAVATTVDVLRRGTDGFALVGNRVGAALGGTDALRSSSVGLTPVLDMLVDTLGEAGAIDRRGHSTAAILLAGAGAGSPHLAEQVLHRLGVVATVDPAPATVFALGALLATAPSAPPTHPPSPAPPPAPPPGTQGRLRSGRSVDRRVWASLAGVVLIALLVATTAQLRAPEPAGGVRTLVAQHARLEVPAQWRVAQRGQLGPTARLTVTPDGVPTARQRLILVQTPLAGSPSVSDVARSLAGQLDERRRDGSRYDRFDPGATYAGRAVISYRELPDVDSVVRWFVVVSGGYQLSVGCQSPVVMNSAARNENDAVCESAVRTVTASA